MEPPPDFEPPLRSAPVVYEGLVDPPLFMPLVIDTSDRSVTDIPFDIPFLAQSGRVGATAWLNLGMGPSLESRLTNGVVPERPGAVSGPPTPTHSRTINFALSVPLRTSPPGPCSRLSVLLYYVDDHDLESGKPTSAAVDEGRVTQVHWWLLTDVAPADVSFADCPVPSQPED